MRITEKALRRIIAVEVRRSLTESDEPDMSAIQIAKKVAKLIAKNITSKWEVDLDDEERLQAVAFEAIQDSIVSAFDQAREYAKSGNQFNESKKKRSK